MHMLLWNRWFKHSHIQWTSAKPTDLKSSLCSIYGWNKRDIICYRWALEALEVIFRSRFPLSSHFIQTRAVTSLFSLTKEQMSVFKMTDYSKQPFPLHGQLASALLRSARFGYEVLPFPLQAELAHFSRLKRRRKGNRVSARWRIGSNIRNCLMNCSYTM